MILFINQIKWKKKTVAFQKYAYWKEWGEIFVHNNDYDPVLNKYQSKMLKYLVTIRLLVHH